MHFLLHYEFAPDYLARRSEFRSVHLGLAWQAVERGDLVLGGAVGDPIDGGLLLFRGESPAAAVDFAEADPYVVNGLVTNWNVKPWHTVIGAGAANPIRG